MQFSYRCVCFLTRGRIIDWLVNIHLIYSADTFTVVSA